jgi:hypothetical protein
MAGFDDIRRLFNIPKTVRIVNESDFEVPQGTPGDKEIGKSQLGTPVFCNLEFLSESYETQPGFQTDTPNLKLEAVLVTVVQPKRIIKTAIDGRDGNVKEYIGMDDYQVQINGVITGSNGVYPADEVARLKRIIDAPVPIGVASRYLNNLGINLIVIENCEWLQEAGSYSYQAFSISCVSDIPQEIRLSE